MRKDYFGLPAIARHATLILVALGFFVQLAQAGCPYPRVVQNIESPYSTYLATACQQFPYANSYDVSWVDQIQWDGENENLYADAYALGCGWAAWVERSWESKSQSDGQINLLWKRYHMEIWTGPNPGSHAGGDLVVDHYSDGCFTQQPVSPILMNFDPGASVPLTSAKDGVNFDLQADGIKMRLAWTKPNANVGWLVHGTEVHDGSALFGNLSQQAVPIDADESENGYRALRLFDSNGDGVVSSQDARFSELNVWFDRDHDGELDSGELVSLGSVVQSVSLDYKTVGKKDENGSSYRFRSEVTKLDGTKAFSYDVFPEFDAALTPRLQLSTQIVGQ